MALARFGSFVAAANSLGISQPGLSRIIQQAEGLLGVTLFLRGTRTVTLSEAGREFVPVAERLTVELEQQTKRIRALDGELRGQLVIASLMSIAHQVLPTALVEFRRRYPKMMIRVREGFGPQVAEDVQSGIVDIGIGNAPSASPDILIESVVDELFFAVLPIEHRLAKRDAVKLDDLVSEQLVSMPIESGLRRLIDLAANRSGVALDHSLITNQFGTLFQFVASGLGVGIVPATVLPPRTERTLKVVRIRPVMKRRIGILRRSDRLLHEPAALFLQLFAPLLQVATSSTDALLHRTRQG
ncbi:MAG: LysR family transcriptional regulator [Hyphomicrobiaceae bacterium]|nr:LysR family transcriptional regulator [Hyphomicrobiaceae bacterium]